MSTHRYRLARAIDSDHSKTFADLVEVIGEWCHEGCNIDAVRVGVCSHEVEHDGTVDGALAALKDVGRAILRDIDDGSEGC